MLNGTSLVAGSLPNDISFGLETKSDGTIVDLLRIVAHLEYNGSEVVCIAFLDNLDSESTLPVILEGTSESINYSMGKWCSVFIMAIVAEDCTCMSCAFT